ncbi:MAG: hypothetical protein KI792_12370 [Alphaproteobacteria bacterium]|nr:hypothetical protein [Alphaproteobacteria bacterium SS10]
MEPISGNLRLENRLLNHQRPPTPVTEKPERARADAFPTDPRTGTPKLGSLGPGADKPADITDVVKTMKTVDPAPGLSMAMMVLNNPDDGAIDANGDSIVNILDIVKNSQVAQNAQPAPQAGDEAAYADIKNVVASISAGEPVETMNSMAWMLNQSSTAPSDAPLDANGDGEITVQDVVMNSAKPDMPSILSVVQSAGSGDPAITMQNIAMTLYGAKTPTLDVNQDGAVTILDIMKTMGNA